MSFGVRLKEERKRLAMTQEQLANLGDLSVQSYRKYESEKLLPNAKYLGLIARVGVDIQYLLTGHRSVNQVAIYKDPTDALANILNLQVEFGAFNAEQITALIGYAWTNQADLEQLRQFVKTALIIAGK